MPIDDFKAVRSGLNIARSFYTYLNLCAPPNCPAAGRTRTVEEINNILQGRDKKCSVEAFLAQVDEICGEWKDYAEDRAMLHQRVRDFLRQKELLSQKYTKTGVWNFECEMRDGKKIINQELYDQAANSGFPPGFFRKTYFDRVTLYCLPDAQDCSESAFNLCSFTVCRINSADFESSAFFNCEFHTCDIVNATFYRAVLDNCRFHDSHCENVSFESALLKSCGFTDGKMKETNYRNATLDGCYFTTTQSRGARNVCTVMVRQSGATTEEERQNRAALLLALKPPPKARQPPKKAKKRGTRS